MRGKGARRLILSIIVIMLVYIVVINNPKAGQQKTLQWTTSMGTQMTLVLKPATASVNLPNDIKVTVQLGYTASNALISLHSIYLTVTQAVTGNSSTITHSGSDTSSTFVVATSGMEVGAVNLKAGFSYEESNCYMGQNSCVEEPNGESQVASTNIQLTNQPDHRGWFEFAITCIIGIELFISYNEKLSERNQSSNSLITRMIDIQADQTSAYHSNRNQFNAMSRRCTVCGHEFSSGERFCTDCGTQRL